MDKKYIEAEYQGRDEYYLTPDKDIVRVGYDYIFDNETPDKFDEGVMGKAIFFYNEHESTMNKRIAEELMEVLPQEKIDKMTDDFIKKHMTFTLEPYNENCHLLEIKCDVADVNTGGFLVDNDEISEIEPKLGDVDYILGDMAHDVSHYYYSVNDIFTLGDDLGVDEFAVKNAVDEDKCPEIPFAEYARSSTDLYSSIFVYETQEHIDEYGIPEDKRAEGFQNAVEQFEAAMDGNRYNVDFISLDDPEEIEESYICFGDKKALSNIPEGSEYLGLYCNIEECLEANQEELGITIDPVTPLAERIYICEEKQEKENDHKNIEKTEHNKEDKGDR